MAAGKELNPTDYISHHLTFLSRQVGEGGGFWTVHLDSVIIALVLGVVGLGFLWWVVRGATSGVPDRRQAFVELLVEFIDDQVRSIFHHGDRHRFVAPAALAVFVWVVLMNAMKFLPVDLMAKPIAALGFHEFRLAPTTDVNTTFALSLSVLLLMIYFNIAVKGIGGWLHELGCAPFGIRPLWAAPFLVASNLLFNAIEYVSKPLSHSLRLFGNMYAGKIIFMLIWLWAATGLVGTIFGVLLGLGWMIFHILIVLLQAYIFMMLTIVYLALAHERH